MSRTRTFLFLEADFLTESGMMKRLGTVGDE